MDEFQTKSTTTYGSFGLLKQSFLGIMVKPLLKVPSITIICKVMAFAKIPLMIENHSRYKPTKINAKGELSFIGIYTQLKAYIPSSINEDDFNNHPEKPHAIGLRLRL
jgi:iron complex outermembrane receptor protein